MKHLATIIAFAVSGYAQAQTLNDSLIAHFPMDGSPDDVIGGLSPTVTSGAPGFCSDRFGNANGAACFDGASFWSYGDVLDMDTSDFSIATWVRVDTVRPMFTIAPGFWSEGSTLIGKGNSIFSSPYQAGYSLSAKNNGTSVIDLFGLTGDDNNGLVLLQTTLEQDEWAHLVLSRCADHQLMFVNGVLVADSITALDKDIDVNTVFCMGGMDRDPSTELDSEWYIGALDDVRLYKGRCLSQTEIDTLAFDLLTVGVDEQVQPTCMLSPNPVGHQLTVTCDAAKAVDGRCAIIDAVGSPVMDLRITSDRTVVDVADLPSGVYFVVFQDDHRQVHGKFIKE